MGDEMAIAWDPFVTDGDPFPAEPDWVTSYGKSLQRTAELIEEQVTLLRKLAQEDSWSTDAADAFREKAEELADKITKVKGRYHDTGTHLVTFAETVGNKEEAAVAKRNLARDQQEILDANPLVEPGAPGADGEPAELTPEQTTQNNKHTAAARALDGLQQDFNTLVGEARNAASECAGNIKDSIDDDVKDDWWDRNAGWIGTLTNVLGWIVTIAAIVMLTVATGGTIWLIALGVGLAAGLISLGLNIGLAMKADGDWWDVAFDAVSVLTLGAGGLLTKIGSKAFPALRSGVASFRATRASTAAMNAFGLRVPITRFFANRSFPFISRMAMRSMVSMSDDAARAGNTAFDAVMATRAVTLPQRLLLGGKDGAQQFVVTRELLAGLRATPGAPANLVQGLTSLNRINLAAAASSLTGLGNNIVKAHHVASDPNDLSNTIIDIGIDVLPRLFR